MKVIKKIPKDRYTIAVPCEMLKHIGLDKGSEISIELDETNNIIILKNPENDSEDILEPQSDNTDIQNTQTEDTLKQWHDEITKDSDNRLPDLSKIPETPIETVEVKIDDAKKKEPVEQCYYCGRDLENDEQLKVNGHRICRDCKKIEVQKLLLYMERRKILNAEKEEK